MPTHSLSISNITRHSVDVNWDAPDPDLWWLELKVESHFAPGQTKLITDRSVRNLRFTGLRPGTPYHRVSIHVFKQSLIGAAVLASRNIIEFQTTPLPPSPTRTLTPLPPPPSPTPTSTFTPTITYTPTVTPTPTATYTPSPTYTPSATYTPSDTPTPSATPSATAKSSPTPTPTNTPVPPTNTPVPPTNTPVPSNTPVPPSNTPIPPTNTPVPSNTPVPPPSDTPVPPTTQDTGSKRDVRISISDATQDGFTVSWNNIPVVDVQYFLELRGDRTEYIFKQSYEERSHRFTGLSADTEYEVKMEAFTASGGTISRDSAMVRTAG